MFCLNITLAVLVIVHVYCKIADEALEPDSHHDISCINFQHKTVFRVLGTCYSIFVHILTKHQRNTISHQKLSSFIWSAFSFLQYLPLSQTPVLLMMEVPPLSSQAALKLLASGRPVIETTTHLFPPSQHITGIHVISWSHGGKRGWLVTAVDSSFTLIAKAEVVHTLT